MKFRYILTLCFCVLMANLCLAVNEIIFSGPTGLTLSCKTYYDNAGTLTLRETISLTEQPASSGIYKGTLVTPTEGDAVRVLDGTDLVGSAEYTNYTLNGLNTAISDANSTIAGRIAALTEDVNDVPTAAEIKTALEANGTSILDWLRDMAEGDTTIDTTATPWQSVVKIKSTATELCRKNLKDVAGGNITNVTTVIGQQVEP